MRVKLYKPFEHWYHGGTIWLISDTHFDDQDCKIMSDNWPTPEEHIKLINKYVSKNDTLIHLGDVGNLEWISKLKGYKILLLGNHDKGVSNYERKWYISVSKEDKFDRAFDSYEESKEYLDEMVSDGINTRGLRIINNGLFDEVYEGPLFINENICLSHEPVGIRFGINIHGHVHSITRYEYWANDCVNINISSDTVEWLPVRLDQIIGGFAVTTLHRQTIDRASKKIGYGSTGIIKKKGE